MVYSHGSMVLFCLQEMMMRLRWFMAEWTLNSDESVLIQRCMKDVFEKTERSLTISSLNLCSSSSLI